MQTFLSNVNPGSQRHRYDPGSLTHVPSMQGELVHSSTSEIVNQPLEMKGMRSINFEFGSPPKHVLFSR